MHGGAESNSICGSEPAVGPDPGCRSKILVRSLDLGKEFQTTQGRLLPIYIYKLN